MAHLRGCVLLFAGVEAATGDWDRSYGTGGLLPLYVPGVPFGIAIWRPQADGKIVTAARAQTATGQDAEGYVIARLNADGTADITFEGHGVVRYRPASDANDESDESFTVNLSNASAGTQIGSGSATVTIVDDDSAPSAPGSGGGSSGGGGGGGGGGGQESFITLLLWAALVSLRLASNGGGLRRPRSKHH